MSLAKQFTIHKNDENYFDRGLSEDAVNIRRWKPVLEQNDTSILFDDFQYLILEQLSQAVMEAHVDGWDGYDARKANPRSIAHSLKFINQLSLNIPPPEVAIDVDGDVALEWDYGTNKVLSVRIGSSGEYYYAGKYGSASVYGREFYSEAIPESIANNISRAIDDD